MVRQVDLDRRSAPGVKSVYDAVVVRTIDDLVRNGEMIYGGTLVRPTKRVFSKDGYESVTRVGSDVLVPSSNLQEGKRFQPGDKCFVAFCVRSRAALDGHYLYSGIWKKGTDF